MKTIIQLLLIVACSATSFASTDTLYYTEHLGGINAAYLRSSFVYAPPPPFMPPQTEEQWLANLNAWLGTMAFTGVDNADPVVLELLRCPNSRLGKPRYAVISGAITPTADVLDVNIPPGYSGINPDGTLKK